MNFEELKKANESIVTTTVSNKQYAEVNQRIKAFRMVFPMGKIITDITFLENGIVTMKATISTDDDKILSTGYAQEKEGSTFINKTSYIENCETSAVGRALGMCGFGIDTSIASLEEVQNAIENQSKQPNSTPVKFKPNAAATAPKETTFIAPSETPTDDTSTCSACGKEIAPTIGAYSIKRYKKALCMDCQKKQPQA